jgi:hypothetical protein
MGRPLKIAKAQTVVTLTATAATTNIITVSSTADFSAGMRFVVASNVGGLVAGTTYWVKEILSGTTFSALVNHPSVQPQVSPTLSTTSGGSVALSVNVVDSGYSNASGYGIVGGDTAIYGNQVLITAVIGIAGDGTISCADDSPNLDGVGTDFANTLSDGSVVTTADGTFLGIIDDIANANAVFATFLANASANVSGSEWVYGDEEAGYVVRQKGKTKYLIHGATTGLEVQAFTADYGTTLLPNTFSVQATYANSANTGAFSFSDHNGELFGDGTLAGSDPAFLTFGSAEAADAANGVPYPVVTIASS